MKFLCLNCKRHELTLADRVCPACGFPFTLRAIWGHYWQGVAGRWRSNTMVCCPHCQKAAPLLAKSCPHCGRVITVTDAVTETTAPIQGAYHRHFDNPTPEFVRRLQWVYFLLSVVLLFVMLSVSGTSSLLEWGWSAALSVIYLAVFVMLFTWLLPRPRASRKPFATVVRLALVLNVLTFVMVLQLVIRNWWLTFVRLAGVLLMIAVAMVFLYRYLWPTKDEFQEAFKKQRSPHGGSFDHLKPQGRKGEHD